MSAPVRRTAALFAALVSISVAGFGCAAPDGPAPAPATAAPATAAPVSSPPPAPSAVPTPPGPTTPGPATPTTPAVGDETLRPGATGPRVRALQQRLTELGYWLGAVDGDYGTSTAHAVTAFQKATGLARDGVAGTTTLRALATAERPPARSDTGTLLEVDLGRQIVLVVSAGRLAWVLDTSTGRVRGSTPTGRYTVYRQVDGYDHGPLGTLYRPKYVVGGVAVHGYPSVPPYPASHGCIRVTDAAMDWLWAAGVLPIGLPVWIY